MSADDKLCILFTSQSDSSESTLSAARRAARAARQQDSRVTLSEKMNTSFNTLTHELRRSGQSIHVWLHIGAATPSETATALQFDVSVPSEALNELFSAQPSLRLFIWVKTGGARSDAQITQWHVPALAIVSAGAPQLEYCLRLLFSALISDGIAAAFAAAHTSVDAHDWIERSDGGSPDRLLSDTVMPSILSFEPAPSQRKADSMRTSVILSLAANPFDTDRLRFDEELREIDDAVRDTIYHHTNTIKHEKQLATRYSDVQRHLQFYKPAIVHFSGHGNRTGELYLEDKSGNKIAVDAASLSALLAEYAADIRLVVLNACWSATHAEQISQHIPCVIGMVKPVSDRAAIEFSRGLYQALCGGSSLASAFRQAKANLGMAGLGDEKTTPLILSANPAALDMLVFTHAIHD